MVKVTLTHTCGHTAEHDEVYIQSYETVNPGADGRAWFAGQICPACRRAKMPKRGWSNAAKRRAAARSHPLSGGVVEAGDGYTVYEDGLTGRGHVRIYDQS